MGRLRKEDSDAFVEVEHGTTLYKVEPTGLSRRSSLKYSLH